MIDRTQFTPDGANPDHPVPFGPNQTVPTERMAMLLADCCGTGGKVLELGTGSGYQTSVLAARFQDVVSVEVQALPSDVAKLLPANVTLISADACTFDSHEEFDAVLVTFAAPQIFHPWWKQVKEGGRLVVPLQIGGSCPICVYRKQGDRLEFERIVAYANFTPMVSA